MRKILWTFALLVFLLGYIVAADAQAETNPFTAKLGYASENWKVQEWGLHANAEITGSGSYRIVYTGSGNGASMLVIDIFGAAEAFRMEGLFLSDLRVLVDGENVAVDLNKVVTGDLQRDGNYRIAIYDPYDESKQDPAIDPAKIVFVQSLVIEFTLSADSFPDVQDPAVTQPSGSLPSMEGNITQPSASASGDAHGLMVPQSSEMWRMALVIGLFVLASGILLSMLLVRKKK